MASVEFEAFMQQIEQAQQELKQARTELDKLHADNQPRLAEHHEEVVKARRAGQMGKAWQTLQSRIDLGKTCEMDIFNGIDKSPEAREVRADLIKNMTKIRDEIDAMDPEEETKQHYRQAMESMAKLQAMEAGMRKDV
ncbi:hypothetical protein [Bifidobacterium criceti]|uniref:Uncharacterized protein n=1 Tax=Bifidobacterium criceti TaxID=1960969 RepID=A0A2A2EIT7_9BIFI|nr:hypothetical protein [Bifidobacterium criceti]PAU68907.1 hypothetical protein B1526_0100 [Bifidobacterium criceti]